MKLNLIKQSYLLIINNFFVVQNTMKKMGIIFEKGINPSKEILSNKKTSIPFINISSMNDKENSYVREDYIGLKNIFVGDIVLSLDGTIGIVNNLLEGFNGYGYKVSSTNKENYQIYFSLLTKTNQNIMKINSTGTTIKHSNKSKEKIILFSFGVFNKLLKLIYLYEMKIKISIKKINSITSILQKLFIK